MKPKFSAYFQFQLDSTNPRFLTLTKKYGAYSGLKGIENKVIKLKFTYSCKLFLNIQQTGLKYAKLRLINNLHQQKNGIAHFDRLNDAVIAVVDLRNSKVEIFIAERSKGSSLFLFQKFVEGSLDMEILELRSKSEEILPSEEILNRKITK